MPPLYQDPLAAVPGAQWRWLDVARAFAEVSCEPWALALVAVAVYAFLERDVRGVLRTFLPLAGALAAAAAIALLARAVGGMPRPVEAGHAIGPLLRRAFPSGQAAAVGAFAAYTALAYRRRALPAVLAIAVVGVARALGRPYWGVDLAGGGVAGLLVGTAAYAAALRIRGRAGAVVPNAGRQGPAEPLDPGSA